jgi:hypothetical protein
MKKFKKTETIQLETNGSVFLTTKVGNGNLGGGNVKDGNGNVISRGLLTNFDLGDAPNLAGKLIIVTTNVLDINAYRDDTPITHTFTGGIKSNSNFEFTEDADEDGVVAFVITYNFSI